MVGEYPQHEVGGNERLSKDNQHYQCPAHGGRAPPLLRRWFCLGKGEEWNLPGHQ